MAISEIHRHLNGWSKLLRGIFFVLIASIHLFLIGCRPFYYIPEYGLVANEDHTPDPGTGKYNIGIVPYKWGFYYPDGGHYFSANTLDTYGITPYFEYVDWTCFVRMFDSNVKPFDWYVGHQVIGMHHSFMVARNQHFFGGDFGHSPMTTQSYVNPFLKGFNAATVVLIGWRFDAWDPGPADRSVRGIGIQIRDVVYDSNEGKISWTVQSHLTGPEAFRYIWAYSYLIIAFNKGAVHSHTVSDDRFGFLWNGTFGKIQAPEDGKGKKHGIALLQGWFVETTNLNYHPGMSVNNFTLESFYHPPNVGPIEEESEITYWIQALFPWCPAVDSWDMDYYRRLTVNFAALYFDDGGIGYSDSPAGCCPAEKWRELDFRYYYGGDFPSPE